MRLQRLIPYKRPEAGPGGAGPRVAAPGRPSPWSPASFVGGYIVSRLFTKLVSQTVRKKQLNAKRQKKIIRTSFYEVMTR